jgi:conjugative transposon TraN protein
VSFTTATNLSVITEDGRFYNFDIVYNPAPIHLSFDISRLLLAQSPTDFHRTAQTDILFADTRGDSPAVINLMMQSIYKQRRLLRHIDARNGTLQSELRSIYTHGSKLFFDVWLKNKSGVPFETDIVSFKIIDRATTGKSLSQELPVEVLRVHQPMDIVKGKSKTHSIFMLEQLSLSGDKLLKIT